MSERNNPEKVSLKYVKWVLQGFFSFLVFPVHGAQSQTVNSLSSGITTKPTEARNSKEKEPGHKVILSWWGPCRSSTHPAEKLEPKKDENLHPVTPAGCLLQRILPCLKGQLSPKHGAAL